MLLSQNSNWKLKRQNLVIRTYFDVTRTHYNAVQTKLRIQVEAIKFGHFEIFERHSGIFQCRSDKIHD